MSEQPLAPLPDPQHAAWHGVAQEMPDWPTDLQQHAARNLGERGLSHLVEAPHDQAATAPLAETASRQEIASAFESGHKTIRMLMTDERFDALCAERGVDPYNTDTEGYWDTLETFVQSRTAVLRQNQRADGLKLDVLELLAATPKFLVHGEQLKRGVDLRGAPQEVRAKNTENKEIASRFNTRLRDFATDFPNVSATGLATELLKFADSADLEYAKLATSVPQTIRSTIRGAQYEMAFGQILRATTERFRPSEDTDEDLRGIDWVISPGVGRQLCVDIKASLSEVDHLNRGHNGTPYHIKRHGDIVLYPLLTDAQFNDSFYISEQTAALTAPQVIAYLDKARYRYN